MEEECSHDRKVKIKLWKSTLARQLQVVKSQAESNADWGWSTDQESDAIITYAICLTDQGWPLNAQWMKEHAEAILYAHIGRAGQG